MKFSWDSVHVRYLRALFIIFLVLYAIFFEPFNLEVTENSFDLFDGGETVKIVLIGDTQDAYNHPEYFQNSITVINAQEPDIILIAGDIVEITDDWDKISLLENLESEYGTYAILGNHDYYSLNCTNCTDKLISKLESMDITVLRNENRVLTINGQEFALIGVDDLWAGRSSYANASVDIPADMPKVILAHNQYSMKNQKLEGRNIILSGHTHCGLVQIPLLTDFFLRWNRVADVARARTTVDEHTELYVTCGVTPGGVRLFTRPEISIIYLE
ncbi:metallophosphoesterase [Candidatus Micrarchaeota archaeon]|nr:metallophosphoesterase [Candidatus Micrarchaeota archaeon]